MPPPEPARPGRPGPPSPSEPPSAAGPPAAAKAARAPALFEAYPALRARLPHRAYVEAPTPVAPLALAGLPEGALFAKHDERSSPLYGGNKPRKLEFVIARALARGARRLVTTGGIGSHHALATAILGREAGLAATLVLMRQPVTPRVREQLRLMRAWGARVVDGGGLAGTALHALAALTESAARGERPALVPTGGSGPDGLLGFVSAGLELDAQIRAGEIPAPAEIYLPVGTGGTLAGLVAGLALAGRRARVVGVLVTDVLPPGERRLRRAARGALARLARLDPSVPRRRLPPRAFELTRAQIGPGYGAATREAELALAAARESGLALETVYTAKCLAEIRARAARGALPEAPVLFWNTVSADLPWARAPGPEARHPLPPALARIAEGELGPG